MILRNVLAFWVISIICFSVNASQNDKQIVFDYKNLAQNKLKIVKEFHDKGYIAVRNVPGFAKAYRKMIIEGRNFIKLSETEKSKVRPENYNTNGWSFGEEKFNGVQDFYKGSYYASIPDTETNMWLNDDFKKSYLTLGNIMFTTGKEILTLIDFDIKKHKVESGIGRMLYYAPIISNKDNENKNWCGLHQGHGLFAALAPGIFFKDNTQVDKPTGSGLYIRDNPIRVANDVLLFQIGETLELLTNGKLTATEHHVQKAFGGYERFAFAFFVNVDQDTVIHSTVTKYNDRFKPGMTYKQWAQAAFDRYYSK